MENIQLLYVDDETAWLESIKQMLSGQGFEVDTAKDGKDALACMERKCYEMILLDIRLKEENGWQLINKLKQQDPWVAIVLYTSVYEIDKLVAIASIDVEDYIEKSMDIKILINRLQALYFRYLTKKRQSEIFYVTREVTFTSGNGCLQVKGKEYFLKSNETKLLYLLCKHKGKVVSTDDLCQRIWQSPNLDGKEKALRNLISQVRKYFEGTSLEIKKMRFEGYYLTI